jgi:formylglycine-generating enzyme required for sulfatase activity
VRKIIVAFFLIFIFLCSPAMSETLVEKVFTSPTLGAKFVLIPAGTFTMGSPSSESGRNDSEAQHQVTISRPFYMQTTDVTQGQWKRVMGNNPSYFRSCGDDCPVEKVSWNDVQEFISKLNNMEGSDKYHLPTEAQWEYAARAGTTTALYNGQINISGDNNAPALDKIAWYGGNSCVDYSGGDDCSGWPERQYRCSKCGTHPVGQKQPNAWGLYDMLGNVWQWCQDWWAADYPSDSVTDPVGPSSGTNRVFRGGSWSSNAMYCRTALRNGYTPSDKFSYIGFRLARTP